MDSFTGNASGNNMVSGAFADIQGTDSVNGGTGLGDTLTLTTAATGAGLTFATQATGFEKLVLANGTNTVTLNSTIEARATTDGAWSTITGGTGFDNVVIEAVAGAQAINLTTVTGIEQFTTNGVNTGITFSGAAFTAIVDASSAGNDTIGLGNFVNNFTVVAGAGTLGVTGNAAGGTDTVTIAGTPAALVTMTDIETVNGSVNGGAVTMTNTAAKTSGSTFNSAANTAAQTIVGTTAADTINLSAAATEVTTIVATDALGGLSTFGAIDTITNFNGATAQFDVSTAAASLGQLTIASADSATFASAIQTAIGGTTVGLEAAYIITVNGGSAAGTYAYQNIDGTTVDVGDFLVKLVGASNITISDFA